jgi:hypothetical protein
MSSNIFVEEWLVCQKEKNTTKSEHKQIPISSVGYIHHAQGFMHF